MEFEAFIYQWINESLVNGFPSKVKAFSFNLYERSTNFGFELVGTSEFDEEDADWVCEEVFEPKQRQIDIPVSYSGKSWQQCLEKMKSLVLSYLETDEPGAVVLKQAQGVGIGFVDGDMDLLTKL